MAAMRGGPVLAGLEALGELTALEELNVAFTAASQGSMLSWTRLTRLRVLNMDSCDVDAKYAGLPACWSLFVMLSGGLSCFMPLCTGASMVVRARCWDHWGTTVSSNTLPQP